MTSANADKLSIVRSELKALLALATHTSAASDNESIGDFSPDDDITVTYLTGIAEDLGASCYDLEDFDQEAFVETLCAYVPPLSALDSCKLKEWIVDVARKVESSNCLGHAATASPTVSSVSAVTCSSLSGVCPAPELPMDKDRNGAAGSDPIDDEDDPDIIDDRVALLLEMFGGMCSLTAVQNSLRRAGGDVDRAVQELLDCSNEEEEEGGRADSWEDGSIAASAAAPSAAAVAASTSGSTAGDMAAAKAREDQARRASILSRYSYVASDDGRDSTSRHCPKPIVSEEKKLIRYRDGQIVSTKGERYMEVKKQETEEMKKTYISLKPLKKYRWH